MMKPLRFVLLAAVTAFVVNAVEAAPPLPMAFAATYNWSVKDHQHGFGLKLPTDLGHRLRLEPEFVYFAAHDDVTALHLNVNLHWRVPLFNAFGVYPLLGLSYSHWGYEGPNASRWGANVGCGAEYRFARRLSALTEVRLLLVSRESQPIYTFGLNYHF